MTRKWLVAHDFSDQADQALARAVEQLMALGEGELLLLHVHAPITTGFAIDLGAATAFQDVDRTLENEARTRLERIGQALVLRHPGLMLRTLVENGNPADHVVEVAKREDVDQIVMGSHGRRGLERFFLGSVAERVLRLADRPMLIVKSEAKAEPGAQPRPR